MKVLLVDDEPNIIMSLEFLMKKQGLEVFIARNGKEAMETAQHVQPGLVILDVMMPEADGFEVCRFIRAQPMLESTKIIILSAKNKDADMQEGYRMGADLYLAKPFSTRVLMQKVKELTAS